MPQRLSPLLIGLLVLAVALGLLWQGALAGLPIDHGYNEGWNAYHALALREGRALYPPADSLFLNNYPPLSFYTLAALGGDLIATGRWLSILSATATALLIFFMARAMGLPRLAGLFAGALFLAKLLAASRYVGMNDPQLFGHALGCAGFALLLQTRPRILAAALLLTLAVFVKHMLIVQPLVLLVWLAFHDRRAARTLLLALVAFGILGLALCHYALGIDLFEALNTARRYDPYWAWESLRDFLLMSFAPFFAGLYLLSRENPYARLCGLYAVIALAFGTVFDGGAGVGRNAMFDAAIACGLSAGFVLQDLRNRPLWRALFVLACITPLAINVLLKADRHWLTTAHWLPPMAQEAATTREDIAFLKSHPGPALCEVLSHCYWAGKKPELDAFNLTEAFHLNQRDQNTLIRQIETKRFSVIQLEYESRFKPFPRITQALRKHYRLVYCSSNGIFYVRR